MNSVKTMPGPDRSNAAAKARLLAQQCDQLEELLAARHASRRATVRILCFLLLVIALECAIVTLAIPNASQTAELAQAQLANSPLGHSAGIASASAEALLAEPVDPREVELGVFQASVSYPSSDALLHVDLRLIGLVEPENLANFQQRFKALQHRFRQEVLLILRTLDPADFSEPGLGLLKRRILEKTNRLLGTRLLEGVVISDFSCRKQ